MRLRYQFRLDPTPAQRIALARAFGCARLVWNDALAARKERYGARKTHISAAELSRRLTTMKKTPERAFLNEVSAVVLQQSLRDLDAAYKNFFDSRKGRRRGANVGLPRFKSRKNSRQSIRLNTNAFQLTDTRRLYVAKVGAIKVRWSRKLPAAPSSVTVIVDPSGRFFASFVVEVNPNPFPSVDSDIGIDVGLTAFAVDDSGRVIASPKFLRQAERKLRKLQQTLSRKDKGSANRLKARRAVARQHVRVADRRRDFLHKQASRLIRENQAIYLEDLNVSGMAKNRRLAKSVHDAGWSTFRAMLEYKAALYGRTTVTIDRWFPSTKTCSACGVVTDSMPLGLRVFACECGLRLDRDHNAAINIRNEGRRMTADVAAGQAETPNASGGSASPGMEIPFQAAPGERGTHQKPYPSRARQAENSAVLAGMDVNSG